MSLLIHGTKLPRSNTMTNAVIRVRQDGTAEIIIHYEHKPESFKLTEVPTPHGRLIDADAFEEKLKRLAESTDPYQRGIGKAVLLALSSEPTIIEAEAGES